MSRARELARRALAGIGMDQVAALRPRVEDLAEAVAENAALAVGLEARVAELEQRLVDPLERRVRRADRS